MFANSDPAKEKPVLTITLDGKPVQLEPPAMDSLASIRAQLEVIALRKERVLSALRVDGIEISLAHTPTHFPQFHSVEAVTMSLADYSRLLLRRVLDQVHALRRRLEAMVLQVMINEWPAIDWLWRGLQADLQAPLIKLSYLHDFYGPPSQVPQQGLTTLHTHWQTFRSIWQRLEEIYVLKDKLALSDALELDLLPWVSELHKSLVSLGRGNLER
jgi:hypothetical protein